MKLFFTTEEVAGHLNLPLPTLEFYIKTFNVKIQKVGKNRRYSHTDLDKLQKIVNLIQVEGYTLEGAREKLKEKKIEKDNKKEVIVRLKEIKKSLEWLSESIE
ncbi:MAG: MerR family transcriptional regulator [Cytophagaceae bacterium]|nr:MerR family transcriptional regulator [Cytophagaceae bacterium]MBK9508075.1 MerR family transcriptional regulator [Cytophagaceae bacterium]MBK9936482.1 MerR family transcriptional regulator [Cytophagaceae bacterium]MBL0300232.1 MerR family transcriptional regulator [Cytophagaceae bacterium]MBL0327169.1 MerR family transcriptional regulator [Cytophagaceae bacterium]